MADEIENTMTIYLAEPIQEYEPVSNVSECDGILLATQTNKDIDPFVSKTLLNLNFNFGV